MVRHEFCPHCGLWQDEAGDLQGTRNVCAYCRKSFVPGAKPMALLARVIQRLAALEQRLDQSEAAATPQTGPGPEQDPEYLDQLQRRKAELEAKRVERRPEAATPPPRRPRLEDIPFAIPASEVIPPMSPLPPMAKEPRPAPRKKLGLEQRIGLQWAGWVGAIVLVVGIGLGIKFGYDQGWFKFMTAEMRLVAMSLVGFGLLGAGEYVYRRINRVSAAALFGAGVATLFVVSYAGNVYFRPGGLPLYSEEVAFIFAALTTLIGAAIAMRGQHVTIAVLAHIGGNLAPFLLEGGEAGVAFYSYLYMLQVVALILALWGHAPRWWALRVLALATTSFWVLMALIEGEGQRGLTDELLWFALLYAFTFQGELLRSCLRIAHSIGMEPLRPSAKAELSGGAIFSTFVTAGITAVVLYIIDNDYPPLMRGTWVLAMAALCLAGGFLLPVREGLSVKTLALGYRVQGIALVILSVPVYLSGLWVSIAWMLLSLTFGVLGARLGRGDARVAGLTTWFLAVVALLIEIASARSDQDIRAIWLTVLEHDIRAYTIIAWTLGLAGAALAWLLHMDFTKEEQKPIGAWDQLGLMVSVLASAVWFITSLTGLPPMGATLALVAWAWLLAGGDFLPNRLGLSIHALAILTAATVKWAMVDALSARLDPHWDAERYLPLWNPLMGLGVLLAASLAAIAWVRRAAVQRAFGLIQVAGTGLFAFGLVVLVMLVLTFGLSLEVDRLLAQADAADLTWPLGQLRGLCFTMLWTLAVLGVAWFGRKLDVPYPLPWVLMLILAVKFLLVDSLVARFSVATPVPALVILNFQALTAVVLLAGLIGLHYLSPLSRQQAHNALALGYLSAGLCVLIGLWVGTLEIDRAFSSDLADGLNDARLAKLVAISIFWSVYAIAAVAVGFRFRAAWLRYFGLALFGVTLVKVGMFDLAQVKEGYRILSSVGLGLLLLGTSVLYGKLSPILLGEKERGAGE